MRSLHKRSRGELVTLPNREVERSIRGNDIDKVNRTLDIVKRSGRFVAATSPVRTRSGEWLINVRYRTGQRTPDHAAALPSAGGRTLSRRDRRRARVAAITAVIMVAGSIVTAAVVWVINNIGKIIVSAVIVAVAAFLIQRLFNHGSSCSGLHCPGCKH
jgi:hypothetical protein